MSRFRFELAGPDDDADLRHVLASTPMAGHVAVSLRREPSWFDAANIDGFTRQVVACRDLDTGHIFGFGCRSLRELYVNGRATTVGYLSHLRVLPEYRNQGLVARGYAYFRRLHQDGRTPFYLTSIAEGNDLALKILTSGRAGLPTYHPAGRYHTIAIALPRKTGFRGQESGVGGQGSGVRCQEPGVRGQESGVRTATLADLPTVIDFLKEVGPRRQFFPRYCQEDFLTATGLLRGLELDRLFLAERAGRLVGILAGWDQHAFRQQVIHGYSGWIRCVRPLYNLTARLRGVSGLPAPGQTLRTMMAAIPVIADDDPSVFLGLLAALHGSCAGGPWSHLLLGLHERDPLLPLARRLQTACYTSLLFLVHWPDGEVARLTLDGRPEYLELGSL